MLKLNVLLFVVGCFVSTAKSIEARVGDTKIVGGQKVEIQDAPFIVMLLVEDRPLCGASIISHNFFLTVSFLELFQSKKFYSRNQCRNQCES